MLFPHGMAILKKKGLDIMDCRFRELRIQKGITQEEFRQDFNSRFHRNYTSSAISLFENNKRIPEISALVDFADYFSVSVDYLIRHDSPAVSRPGVRLTKPENAHLKKYRALSQKGKDIVDGTLEVVYLQEQPPAGKTAPAFEKRETC